MALHGNFQPGVELREVLPGAEWLDGRGVRITSCCADSRRVQPGDLFVALSGVQHNGHNYLAEAIARGAAALLTAEPIAGATLPVCVVHDTQAAFGRLCQALQGNPSQRLKVIGVTGTNGKTTTTHLIRSVLEKSGHPTGLLGTLGYWDGAQHEPAPWTTPSAPVLARCLGQMEANGCTHAAMEVSSHALSQSRVSGVEFDAVCVTNIRRDHFDYHGDAQRYRQAKAKIFQHLRPGGLTVLNIDDAETARFVGELRGPALTVGIRAAADITATVLEQHISEQTFLLSAGSHTAPVRTTLIAAHNVYNCLVAAAVGLGYGCELTDVVRGLEALSSVPGRLERIECGQPFSVFVDFAHTADALAGCLETLRTLARGRLICVFGAGGDRDRTKRPLMGRVVNELADVAVVTNDNPRSEAPQEIAGEIVAGMPRGAKVQTILDRGEAIAWALRHARPGDCVLIAGKGHEAYQDLGSERVAFDDGAVAREWLYSHAA